MARTFIDDLPASERASGLRAEGRITAASKSVEISFGEGEEALRRTVGVGHIRFGWNGGSWRFLLCPNCAKLAHRLRLNDGRLQCRRCLLRDGARYRIANGDGAVRAEARAARIASLQARLGGGERTRLRRKRLEASLRRAALVERRNRFEAAGADAF